MFSTHQPHSTTATDSSRPTPRLTMRFSGFVLQSLALAIAAFAIEIRFYDDPNNCFGNYIYWYNVPTNSFSMWYPSSYSYATQFLNVPPRAKGRIYKLVPGSCVELGFAAESRSRVIVSLRTKPTTRTSSIHQDCVQGAMSARTGQAVLDSDI